MPIGTFMQFSYLCPDRCLLWYSADSQHQKINVINMKSNRKICSGVWKHESFVKKVTVRCFLPGMLPLRDMGTCTANKQHWSSHGVLALWSVTLSQLQEDVMNSACLWRELWALRDKTKDILHVWYLATESMWLPYSKHCRKAGITEVKWKLLLFHGNPFSLRENEKENSGGHYFILWKIWLQSHVKIGNYLEYLRFSLLFWCFQPS